MNKQEFLDRFGNQRLSMVMGILHNYCTGDSLEDHEKLEKAMNPIKESKVTDAYPTLKHLLCFE